MTLSFDFSQTAIRSNHNGKNLLLQIYKMVVEIIDIKDLFDSSAKIFKNSAHPILSFAKIDLFKIPPHTFMAVL